MSEISFKNAVNNVIEFHNQTTYTPYRRGTPDHWYSGHKADLWVEYKFRKYRPKTTNWKNLLKDLQWDWCNDRYKEGRNVWVICGYGDGKQGVILKSPRISLQRIQFDKKLLPKRTIANAISDFCNPK